MYSSTLTPNIGGGFKKETTFKRECGKSVVCEEGWYDEKMLAHREHLPAVMIYGNVTGRLVTTEWYKHGVHHNLKGPAVIQYSYSGEAYNFHYYINGVSYSEKEFKEFVKGLTSEQQEMLADVCQSFD